MSESIAHQSRLSTNLICPDKSEEHSEPENSPQISYQYPRDQIRKHCRRKARSTREISRFTQPEASAGSLSGLKTKVFVDGVSLAPYRFKA